MKKLLLLFILTPCILLSLNFENYNTGNSESIPPLVASSVVLYGSINSRPSPSTAGRIYLASDSIVLSYDNGTSWENYGPLFPLTPPSSTSFPISFNTAELAFPEVYDYTGLHVICSETTNAHRNIGFLATAPTAPYSFEAAIKAFGYTDGAMYYGLMIRDSNSGKFQTIGYEKFMALSWYNWSAAATYVSATHAAIAFKWTRPFIFMKLENSGDTFTFRVSNDGEYYYKVLDAATGTFSAAGYDQIGVYINPNTTNICGGAVKESSYYFDVIHWLVK